VTASRVVTVFVDGPDGGNPVPLVLNASALSDSAMQDVARSHGLESVFVVDNGSTGCDVALRFWVPNHEMSMCGHATLGATWLLVRDGSLPDNTDGSIHTASGVVKAKIRNGEVVISQPAGVLDDVSDRQTIRAVLDVLGLAEGDLGQYPIRNGRTTRVKTLIPLRDIDVLDGLTPDFDRVEALCDLLGSTGLYPYAQTGTRQFDSRQFPRSSGYPEDAATGIAAAALTYGLLADHLVTDGGGPIVIRQGRTMGRPSKIQVELESSGLGDVGCWLGGVVRELL
jgi:PhzF family phenazine biosynthesis protein